MNLDMSNWKPFRFGELIDDIYKAEPHSKVLLNVRDRPHGDDVPFVTRTESSNGVDCYVSSSDVETEPGNALVIGDTTSTISYQSDAFSTGDHIVVIRANWLNVWTGLFIVTLLRKERFRYSYGRAFRIPAIKEARLLLPAKKDETPDWQWVEQYVKSLKARPLSTNNGVEDALPLDTRTWRPFLLCRLFDAGMGNGIDAIMTNTDKPKYHYVSRNSNGNGVVSRVDEIDDAKPFPPGSLTLALGGSYLGACFVQDEPFYTAQNVAVLQDTHALPIEVKLFIATLVRFESGTKYQAFGRELNAHYKKDFTVRLPVQQTADGSPRMDDKREYSHEGYIPDWEYMRDYIKHLPYADGFPRMTA